VIKLAQSWDIEVEERPVAIDEVIEANKSGTLREIFASGTAAVISPVGELFYEETSYQINNGEAGELSVRFYEDLQAIQNGSKEDPFGWTVKVG
jgi:branched-chain amino acid aminotransferase